MGEIRAQEDQVVFRMKVGDLFSVNRANPIGVNVSNG